MQQADKILITGTGRSGTHYTAHLLEAIGLDVPHEAIGRHGAASWKHIRSGRFEVIGKGRVQEIDACAFTTTLHQVRHPLRVIASMQTFSLASWTYMAKFIELDLEAPLPIRGMQAWLGWNKLIEPEASWRFQIEQIETEFPHLCRYFNRPPAPLSPVPRKQRDSRSTRYKALLWNDLDKSAMPLAQAVRGMAKRYGYNDLDDAQAPPPGLRQRLTKFFQKS